MSANLVAFAVALLASFGAALAIHALIRSSVSALLDEVVRIPAGTTFYFRVLCLCLMLSAGAAVLGSTFDLKPSTALMEYVWKIAAVLSNALSSLLFVLLGFLAMMTILVAVLHRRE
jgi:hypothetical protein